VILSKKVSIFQQKATSYASYEALLKEQSKLCACSYGVLEMHRSEGLHEMGYPKWQLVLCLLLVYSMLYLSLFKGVKSSGGSASTFCSIIQKLRTLTKTPLRVSRTMYGQCDRRTILSVQRNPGYGAFAPSQQTVVIT
jgi:hypothetical protein